jgi:hypothetical protein
MTAGAGGGRREGHEECDADGCAHMVRGRRPTADIDERLSRISPRNWQGECVDIIWTLLRGEEVSPRLAGPRRPGAGMDAAAQLFCCYLIRVARGELPYRASPPPPDASGARRR